MREETPPTVVPKIGGSIVALPDFVVLGPRITAAQGPVKIPDWTGLEATFAILGHVGTADQTIDVHSEDVQDVVVDPRRAVDVVEVRAIFPPGGEIGRQGIVELLKIITDVVPLRGVQIGEFGLADPEGEGQAGEAAPQLEIEFVAVRQIEFEEVAAGDFFRAEVVGGELREVHALAVDAQRISQDVDAHIVALIEVAAIGIEEQFHHLGARCPAAEPVAQGVNEGVIEKRAVVIPRTDERPVLERGQAVEGQRVVAAQGVVESQGETFLGEIGGRGAAHVGGNGTQRGRRYRHRGVAGGRTRPRVNPAGAHVVTFHERTGAVGVDHHQWQLAGKRIEPRATGRGQPHIVRGGGKAGGEIVGTVDHGPHDRRS